MLENNNKEIIKKLSNRSLKVNKMRNVFAILAIALTTLLITTTITGGITFYNTNKAYMNVSTYGIEADGYININDEESLKRIDNIKKMSVVQLASEDTIKNSALAKEQVVLEATDDKAAYEMMAIVPIEGAYPKDAEDILLPTWVLDLLEIDKKVGERVNLDIVINEEVKSIEFNLCGYYESLVTRGVGRTRALVSNKFVDKYNKNITNIEGTKTAYVNLKNIKSNSSYETVQDELEKISNEIGGNKAKAHPKYEKAEGGKINNDVIQQGIAVLIAIILVIATGYLIIYNIFYISVTKDLKFYGLLKTIGTTSKQLKRIIIKQAFKLSSIGIPIGLILGYGVAVLILPIALSFTVFGNIVIVSKSPVIFILSIMFSLLTVLISCNKPGKIAGKVSPIEAVRFVSSDADKSKKKDKKGTNGAKLHKMAWGNMVKSKKRVILSVLSISLSAIIVIFTVNTTIGIDPKKHAEDQMAADISVNNVIGQFWGKAEYQPITEDIISKIQALDFVKDLRKNYSAIVPTTDGMMFDFGVELKLEGKLKDEFDLGEKSGNQNIRYSMISPTDNKIKTNITALNSNRLDEELKKFEVIDGEINAEKFKTGDYIIYNVFEGDPNVIKVGDIIPFTMMIKDKDDNFKEVIKEFEVMAIVADRTEGGSVNNIDNFNIEEAAFKELFPNYKDYIRSIDIDLKDNVDLVMADNEINKIINESGNIMLLLTSKNFYIEGMKEMKSIFLIVGGVLAFILGFIGLINVSNTMITSMISRRVEFAMLESIGMTKSQQKKMIIYEGLYYIALTSIVIIPVGLITSFIAPMMLPIAGGFNLISYLISVLLSLILISVLIISVSLIGYRCISKESLIERLRVVE